MNDATLSPALSTYERGCQAADLSIPELVGEVYEFAPDAERTRLLEQLLRPLGLLSLVAIAGGIFAQVRLRAGWPTLQLRMEDVAKVRGSDVIALVEHVQQVSVEAVDGLAQLLAASPMLSSSAAAALLVAVLAGRARSRARARDDVREGSGAQNGA